MSRNDEKDDKDVAPPSPCFLRTGKDFSVKRNMLFRHLCSGEIFLCGGVCIFTQSGTVLQDIVKSAQKVVEVFRFGKIAILQMAHHFRHSTAIG